MRRAYRCAAASVIAGIFGFMDANSAAATPYRTAVLQGLDKVTARVSTLSAPIGSTVRFGTLEIIVRHCDKRPPEETPESAAFLDVWQVRPGESATSLFRGWMFASSPALSALEHPVYDVWVLDCEDHVAVGEAPAGTTPARSLPSPVVPATNSPLPP